MGNFSTTRVTNALPSNELVGYYELGFGVLPAVFAKPPFVFFTSHDLFLRMLVTPH